MISKKPYSFKTDGIKTHVRGNTREIIGTVLTGSIDSYGTAMTQRAMDSFLKQIRTKKVMVDPEHQAAFLHNIKTAINSIKNKSGLTDEAMKKEIDTILKSVKYGDLPIAKIVDCYRDGETIQMLTQTNEAYAEVDDTHNQFYHAFLKSIDTGFIDGFSPSFFPTKFVIENGVQKIDDLVVTGVALTGGASNADCTFSKIITRCAMDEHPETLNEVRMATEEQVNTILEEQKALKAELEAFRREKAEAARVAQEAAQKAADEVRKAQEQRLNEENARLKAELESFKRRQEIEAQQNSFSAERKGLAPQGNPSVTPTQPNVLKDKLPSVIKELESNVVEPKKYFPDLGKRAGRNIVDPTAHKEKLMAAIRLQYAANGSKQAGYLGKDSNDVLLNKLNR